MNKKDLWLTFRKKLCASMVFLTIIAYVLVSYYLKCWNWTLFIFLAIPVSPFILGLEKIHINYELIIVILYLFLGFQFNLWHPYWVLFLTIPVYYILFSKFSIRNWKNKKVKETVEGEFVE